MSQANVRSQKLELTPSEKLPQGKNKRLLRSALFIVGGGVLGFAYYRFIGCSSGTCPITSNPFISTAYGALMGLLMSGSLSLNPAARPQ
jgi:hypothetical protein